MKKYSEKLATLAEWYSDETREDAFVKMYGQLLDTVHEIVWDLELDVDITDEELDTLTAEEVKAYTKTLRRYNQGCEILRVWGSDNRMTDLLCFLEDIHTFGLAL